MSGSVAGVGLGGVGAGGCVAVVIETVRHTYRLRSGGRGEVALFVQWNRCRFFWNEAVYI